MLAIKNSTLHEAKESKRQLSLLSLDPWFSNSTILWLIIWLSVFEAFVLPKGVMKLEGCFRFPEYGWEYQEIFLSEPHTQTHPKQYRIMAEHKKYKSLRKLSRGFLENTIISIREERQLCAMESCLLKQKGTKKGAAAGAGKGKFYKGMLKFCKCMHMDQSESPAQGGLGAQWLHTIS